jgi:hypothetical protein
MAAINFLAGNGFTIQDLAGSGLGFFGDAGFGASVKVGDYQGRTFITNGTGTTQGPEADNVKYLNAGSGILGQAGSGIALTCIPNYQATLNVRFTNATPVKTQNAYLRIYDRTDPNKPASGVTTKVAEVIHPDTTQGNSGSGDTTWQTPGGSGSKVSLAPSPGVSGLYAGNGADGQWNDNTHDWYVAISASPDSIGAKSLYGAYVELEYL